MYSAAGGRGIQGATEQVTEEIAGAALRRQVVDVAELRRERHVNTWALRLAVAAAHGFILG
jgi:hypothetical protein